MNKNSANTRPVTNKVENRTVNSRSAETLVQSIWLSAQRELEQVKRIRAEAERYQKETAIRANSQAHQLLMRTRLAVRKEVVEIKRKAMEELQNEIANFRQEAQEKFGMKAVHDGSCSLDGLCRSTLGMAKTGHGAKAPSLIQNQEWAKVFAYNLHDVRLTTRLWSFGRRFGFVFDGKGNIIRVDFTQALHLSKHMQRNAVKE